MAQTVFIDGAAGTTGLEIADRLAGRPEFELVVLEGELRKDAGARRDALNSADFAILCLPDDAAREAVELLDENSTTRVIDASTAHRVASGWIYGFPEIVGRQVVAEARFVSNPGCYSTGFIGLLTPLIRAGLLPEDWPYTVHAVSGYSGGGKALIERFETDTDIAWRGYALSLGHKHVPEMQQRVGLTHPPVFCPAVIPAMRGMAVEIPLPLEAMRAASEPAAMLEELGRFYQDSPVVSVENCEEGELLLRRSRGASDRMELFLFSDSRGEQARLVAMLDNLGKGASGAAVQSLNLMAGLPETAGLRL
ncbi:N-acetyl-gamma-glutamyl-phosphate reductase [Altererythrobacter atlanticus]|uniref:N-acetyl-gamma-glutamyl-phosphate reductase n=1 Tax=Croceibacterium atlanticum TaxID=1267766 RepID=A0A0F7KT68_9SPHN|nr:N-acetyl-gamma-glutamyl-phosphate reductase [Croceibacterium atlanticum]AKH42412.1 N-acetyl-gamma-glutamyl-phosphate reductase [Croceibacterium atlanticum]MBB5731189.1 N-acetyl-gamma-glutamyl-phosphate reductase [Croceibacterium atlanticum]